MSEMGIDQVLAQMRAMREMTGMPEAAKSGQADAAGRTDFAGVLKDTVDRVSETQQASAGMQAAFEANDPNVDLADVMIAMQKSSVSFQAMVSVRNKLVSAYQEIMSMPV